MHAGKLALVNWLDRSEVYSDEAGRKPCYSFAALLNERLTRSEALGPRPGRPRLGGVGLNTKT